MNPQDDANNQPDDGIIELTDIIEKGAVPAATSHEVDFDRELQDLFKSGDIEAAIANLDLDDDLDAFTAPRPAASSAHTGTPASSAPPADDGLFSGSKDDALAKDIDIFLDAMDGHSDGIDGHSPKAHDASAPGSAIHTSISSVNPNEQLEMPDLSDMDSLLKDLQQQSASAAAAPAGDSPDSAELDALLDDILGGAASMPAAAPHVGAALPEVESASYPDISPSDATFDDLEPASLTVSEPAAAPAPSVPLGGAPLSMDDIDALFDAAKEKEEAGDKLEDIEPAAVPAPSVPLGGAPLSMDDIDALFDAAKEKEEAGDKLEVEGSEESSVYPPELQFEGHPREQISAATSRFAPEHDEEPAIYPDMLPADAVFDEPTAAMAQPATGESHSATSDHAPVHAPDEAVLLAAAGMVATAIPHVLHQPDAAPDHVATTERSTKDRLPTGADAAATPAVPAHDLEAGTVAESAPAASAAPAAPVAPVAVAPAVPASAVISQDALTDLLERFGKLEAEVTDLRAQIAEQTAIAAGLKEHQDNTGATAAQQLPDADMVADILGNLMAEGHPTVDWLVEQVRASAMQDMSERIEDMVHRAMMPLRDSVTAADAAAEGLIELENRLSVIEASRISQDDLDALQETLRAEIMAATPPTSEAGDTGAEQLAAFEERMLAVIRSETDKAAAEAAARIIREEIAALADAF